MTGTEHSVIGAARPTGPTAATRSLAPDLARGMMLLLIALANVSWHLWGHDSGLVSAHPLDGDGLDRVFQVLMIVAVDARIYPMFAFLFGYGMVQFHRSRIRRGLDEPVVRHMLWRRHWALLLFGLVHAALLFVGDILGAYGLAGLMLVWLFFRRRDLTVLIWAGFLVALLAFGAVLSLVSAAIVLAVPEAAGGAGAGAGGFSIGAMRELTAGQENYLVSAGSRVLTWLVGTPAQLAGLAIPACIMLGWVAARHRLLDDPAEHRRTLRRIAGIGIPIAWLGGLPGALAHMGVISLPGSVGWAFAALASVTGIAGGIGYAALFGLLALRWGDSASGLVQSVAAVGERSLSFYLFQSLLFAPLLSAWGFGLGARIGTTEALAIAAAVWLVSIPLAVILARQGRRGPFEAVLRRLTYGRLDTGARTPQAS